MKRHRGWLIAGSAFGVVVPIGFLGQPAEPTPKIVHGARLTHEFTGGLSCRCPHDEWFGLGPARFHARVYEVRRPYSEVVASLRQELAAEGYETELDPKWNFFTARKNVGSIFYGVRATPPDGIVSTERYPIVAIDSGHPTNAADLVIHWAHEAAKRFPKVP